MYNVHTSGPFLGPATQGIYSSKTQDLPSISGTMPPKEDTDKLATSKTSNFTPLGDLSVLPRELRDEIYSHVCNEGFSYNFHDGGGILGDKGSQIWCGLGLPMLKVSNGIRDEFQAVLHSKGVFEIGENTGSIPIQRNDIPFVNDILNITVFVGTGFLVVRRRTRLGVR